MTGPTPHYLTAASGSRERSIVLSDAIALSLVLAPILVAVSVALGIGFGVDVTGNQSWTVGLLVLIFLGLVTRDGHDLDPERLMTAVESSIDGIAMLDEAEEYVYYNEAYVDIYGYDEPEALLGEDWRIGYHDEEVARLEREAFPVLYETGSWRGKAIGTRADGTRYPQELSLTVLDDDGGMVCVTRDVSERTERENQLHARERKLERHRAFTDDLLDAVEDVFYVIDAAGDLERWNESLPDATGYDDAEIGTMNAVDFFVEEDRGRIAEAVQTVFEGGHVRVEATVLTKSGETVPYEFAASRLEDPDGNPVVVGIGRDVSERVERERELERAETIIQAVGDPVYAVDADGNFRFVNDAIESLSGWDPETLIGEHISTVMADEDLETAREVVRELLRTDDTYRPFEMDHVTADGGVVETENNVALLPTDDGEYTGTAGVVRDISDRKERERQLERTTSLLEQADRLANLGAWELDVTGSSRTVWMSDEVARIHGISPDDTLDLEEALSFYHPDDRSTLREAIEDAVEAAETYDLELRLVPADGEQRWIRTIGEPVEDTVRRDHTDNQPESGGEKSRHRTGSQTGGDDSEVVAVRGAFQDVTERKERERELERATDLLEQAQRLASVGGFELDMRTDPPEATNTAETYRILDAPQGTDFGIEGALELFHPEDRPRVQRAVEAALECGERYDVEARLITLTGQERWLRCIGEPIEEDGDVVTLLGSFQDITERKERERELERATDLLEQAERLADSGGWEYDVQSDPPELTMTDGLRELYELSRDVERELESDPAVAQNLVVPADRPRVQQAVDDALEHGESYDLEHRMETYQGTKRWVRSVGEPIVENTGGRGPGGNRTASDDGEVVALRGSIRDVTEHKERELTLESLHDTARGLLGTESRREAAELVAETSGDVLDVTGVALYILDEETNELNPVAYTPGYVESCGPARAVPSGHGESLLWNVFVTGTQTVADDPASIDRSVVLGEDVEQALLVPIGDHGVFTVVSTAPSIGSVTRRTVETLVATAVAAFDRLESEASLRQRDAALAEQNRRLRRQRRIDEILRSIHGSLVAAESREEIERTVPEQLVAADGISFAWIGAVDSAGADLETQNWAGNGGSYLDAVSLAREPSTEPATVAVDREEPVIVSNVVEGLKAEPWRTDAIARGFHSIVAVPLTYQDYTYGVLAVYAEEPNWFGELEREVYAELGEGIANAINAVQTRAALHAENYLELTLRVEAPSEPLSRIAHTADCRVEFQGLGTHSGAETLFFFVTEGVDSADVSGVLDELVTIDDYRLVGESNGECLFEATVAGDVLASRLVRHGASPRSISADATGTTVVVDVATTTDVRGFVELFDEEYASVELVARRTVQRAMHTRRQLVTSLFDELTERQVEVLRTAYFAGFFDWPRESTGEEVAAMLDISQPTVNRHLRLAQRRLLGQLFESEVAAVVAG